MLFVLTRLHFVTKSGERYCGAFEARVRLFLRILHVSCTGRCEATVGEFGLREALFTKSSGSVNPVWAIKSCRPGRACAHGTGVRRKGVACE